MAGAGPDPNGLVRADGGESASGKTFLAIELARALSQGTAFVTKKARQGGTLYVAAEAPGTIPNRLRAARLGPLELFLDETGRDKSTGEEPKHLCVAVTADNVINIGRAMEKQTDP
jgi:AAA domain